MSDVGSAVVTIYNLVSKAIELWKGCLEAPKEIRLAADQVRVLSIALENVKCDIVDNEYSFWHKTDNTSRRYKTELELHFSICNRVLSQSQSLLKKFNAYSKQGSSTWDNATWAHHGKSEMAAIKADIVLATNQLEMFLTRVGPALLWKVESLMETLAKRAEGASHVYSEPGLKKKSQIQTRARSGSCITRALVVGMFVSKLKARLAQRKGLKKSTTFKVLKHDGVKSSGKVKPLKKVKTVLGSNPQRDAMLRSYANSIVAPERSQTLSKTPRNDQPPRPVKRQDSMEPMLRRTDSIQQVLRVSNPSLQMPFGAPVYFACWRVKTGQPVFGPKIVAETKRHMRGQIQLKDMASIFQEATKYTRRGIEGKDMRAKHLKKQLNAQESRKGSGKKWYFASGMVMIRDPGKSGLAVAEKALLIMVRTKA